jgi:hypothetical protein
LDGRLGGGRAHRSSESHPCRGATRGPSESISLAYRKRSGVASSGITDDGMEPVVAARPGGWYRHDRLVVDLSVWLNEKNPRLAEERRFLVAPSSRGEQPLLSHRSFSETAGEGRRSSFQSAWSCSERSRVSPLTAMMSMPRAESSRDAGRGQSAGPGITGQ